MPDPRIFIDVRFEDDMGISPEDWELPEDCTAQSVIEMMKADSQGDIRRAIREFDLAQWPEIRVSVRRDGHYSDASWSAA